MGPGKRPWLGASPGAALAAVCVLLSVLYVKPLLELIQLAWRDDLQSHIVLIPFVSLYLVWLRRMEIAHLTRVRGSSLAAALVLLGSALAIAGVWGKSVGGTLVQEDSLCLLVVSYVVMVWASALFLYGNAVMWSLAFPAGLLLFLAPIPKSIEIGLEHFLQRGSAEAAAWLFNLAGTPLVRDGTIFRLPGLTIEIAPECSGIRSSFVLFLTSLLAGYLFLQTPWRRALLTLWVLPLGILRNGFRIFTLGMLCVHVDKQYLDSWVHHKGGPLFFVLSLIPFYLLLVWLRRSESGGAPPPSAADSGQQTVSVV
jgi:exosortase C (VPDSG-CTERM-specific)